MTLIIINFEYIVRNFNSKLGMFFKAKYIIFSIFSIVHAIQNGDVAFPGEFPYVVQVYPSQCVGALVKANFIITAASCQPRQSHGHICRSLLRNDQTDCVSYNANGNNYLPSWNSASSRENQILSDILIIQLNNNFRDRFGWIPAQIIPYNSRVDTLETVWVAGFGKINNNQPTTQLRRGDFRTHGELFRNNNTVTLRSFIPNNYGVLSGDEGTAFTIFMNGQYTIIGTQSFIGDLPSGPHHLPHRDWINAILENTTPPPPPPPQGCPIPNCNIT